MEQLPIRPDMPVKKDNNKRILIAIAAVVVAMVVLGGVGAALGLGNEEVPVTVTPASPSVTASPSPVEVSPTPEPEPVVVECAVRHTFLAYMRDSAQASTDVSQAASDYDIPALVLALKDVAYDVNKAADEVYSTDPAMASELREVADLHIESANGWDSGRYSAALASYRKAISLLGRAAADVKAGNYNVVFCDEV